MKFEERNPMEEMGARISVRFLSALALLTVACTGGDQANADLPVWTVGPDPVVSIGALEGDTAFLFDEIRTARFAADGRIVVGDAGLGVVRVFDAEGGFLVQMGREGDGPGEFTVLRDLWMASPDTVGVWDSRSARLTYFGIDGSLLRSQSVRVEDGVSLGNLDLLAAALGDGSVVVGELHVVPPQAGELHTDVIELHHFEADGTYGGSVGSFPGLVRGPGGPPPFSPYPYFTARRDSIYFTDGLLPRVQVHTLGRTGAQVIVLPERDVSAGEAWDLVTAELEAREHWQLDRLPDMERSDEIPHLAGLLVDDEGLVWSKRFDPGQDALWLDGGRRVRGGHWWVMDPVLGMAATAELPPNLVPLEVREGRILGLEVDGMGVERVVVYEIQRP